LKSNYLFSLVLFSVLFSLPRLALAGNPIVEQAQIVFDVPTGWKVQTNKSTVTLVEPKEEASFVLIVLDAKDLKEAIANLDSYLAKNIDGFATKGKAKEGTLNTLKTVTIDGEGTIQKRGVQVRVVLVQAPNGKMLALIGFAEADKMKSHQAEFKSFFTSIRPNPIYTNAKIAFELPNNWTLKTNKDILLSGDPKGEVLVVFTVKEAKDIKDVVAKVASEVKKIAKDFKTVGKSKEVTINTLPITILDGTGVVDGKSTNISVFLVKTPNNKVMTMLWFLNSSTFKTHEKDVKSFLSSLSPVE
jgi:hypothetical protein